MDVFELIRDFDFRLAGDGLQQVTDYPPYKRRRRIARCR